MEPRNSSNPFFSPHRNLNQSVTPAELPLVFRALAAETEYLFDESDFPRTLSDIPMTLFGDMVILRMRNKKGTHGYYVFSVESFNDKLTKIRTQAK